MNLFDYQRIAEGYANDRPSFHPVVMAKVREELGLSGNFQCGLDVGCGSGASAMALTEICDEVIGMEASAEMVRVAKKKYQGANIRFLQCKAEESPFQEDAFEIVTASGSIQWIDPRLFLPLMGKQIIQNGWLVIYDNAIANRISDGEGFARWYRGAYPARFPKPPRNEEAWNEALLRPYGFHLVKQEEYTNTVLMNRREFVSFMITQSNVTAAVEQGGQSLESVKEWFNQTLDTIFSGGSKEIRFEGYIWYIQNGKHDTEG